MAGRLHLWPHRPSASEIHTKPDTVRPTCHFTRCQPAATGQNPSSAFPSGPGTDRRSNFGLWGRDLVRAAHTTGGFEKCFCLSSGRAPDLWKPRPPYGSQP